MKAQTGRQPQTGTPRPLAPVNECIYCGSKRGLSNEHIIPLALGGEWVLPKASCGDCQQATARIEFETLRRQLFEVRAKLGMPSRRKSLPDELPVTVQLDEGAKTFFLPKARHPTLACFLLYPLPGILSGKGPEKGITVIGVQTYQIGGPQVTDLMGGSGAKRRSFTFTINGNEFERMLAKVALGFAVAALGLDAVRDPPIRDTIRGVRDDAGRWVGTGRFHPPPSTQTHFAEIWQYEDWVVVAVRLFAYLRAPEYVVVVRQGVGPPPPIAHGVGPDDPKGDPSVKTNLKIELKPRASRSTTQPT